HPPSPPTYTLFPYTTLFRSNFGYTGYRFKLFTAIQDVRVWGQDGSSINRITVDVNDGFMLHEAWGELSLVDTGKVIKNFTLKIGDRKSTRLNSSHEWISYAV